MSNKLALLVKHCCKAPLFSPRGFAIRALLLALIFAVCHLLRLREHTSFMSGTAASAETSLKTSAFLGVIYMATYFSFVLLVPILLIAAGIQFLLQFVLTRLNQPS